MRSIDACGVISLLAVATGTLLSVFLAATQPALNPRAPHTAWFAALEPRLSFLPGLLTAALHRAGPLASGFGFVAGYCGPLLVSSASALGLLLLLYRRREELCDRDARRALGWAIAFTVVAAPAFNVLTQDIWLSVAWGRLLQAGGNPFAEAYAARLAADLPLEYDPMPMTYGPFWAVVCRVAVALGAGSPLATWLLLKLVLGAAWLICLWTVHDGARPFGPAHQTRAILIAGWLPAGLHCDVAEGHNDVVMVAAALLWLRSLGAPGVAGPLWLALSILTKYVTAPLLIVDLIYHAFSRKLSVKRYLVRVLPAALLLLAGLACVALSARGIGVTSSMRDWKFLDPADVFRLLARYSGLPIDRAGSALVAAVLAATALVELVSLAKSPLAGRARRAMLAVMALTLFAVVGHVWPWFFVWCFPLAALVPDFWLAWFVIGAASIAPFTIVHWWHFGIEGGALRAELPSLVMYAVAVAVAVLASRNMRAAIRLDRGARARVTTADNRE